MRYYLFIIILILLIVILLNIIYTKNSYQAFSSKITFINLVLFSNDNEYDNMYDITKKYYSKFSNVKTIYYQFNEQLIDEYELKDDILFIRGSETYIPGILKKTFSAFQYIDKHYDFDYVVRSNISTIVDFDLLTDYLQDTHIQYGGGFKNSITAGDNTHPDLENLIYASGTSILFAKTILKEFLNKKQHVRYDLIDDVSIGLLIRDHLPHIEPHYIPENRFIFISDNNGVSSKIVDSIRDKSYIFYRNRQADRKTDVKQMKIIIEYLSK